MTTQVPTAQEVPRLVDGGEEAGAAAGGGEAPVEEEFDLADIMGEQVEAGDALTSKEEQLKKVDEQLKVSLQSTLLYVLRHALYMGVCRTWACMIPDKVPGARCSQSHFSNQVGGGCRLRRKPRSRPRLPPQLLRKQRRRQGRSRSEKRSRPKQRLTKQHSQSQQQRMSCRRSC